MQRARWKVFRWFAGIIGLVHLWAPYALAQTYPAKPIRIVVGFVAGGATDATARLVAQELAERLSQLVVVENRPGAGSAVAIERVATSPADGYTLLLLTNGATILPALRKLPFDLASDLAPISLVALGASLLVVHPSVPARNVKELIALARAQPGKLSYGSAGVGSSSHLATELFNLMVKVRIVHVPYKGGAESAVATAAGQIDMAITDFTAARPLLDAGKLRALATVGGKRISSMPSVPTLDESGLPGYDRSAWFGVLAPAGVPKDIIARLNAAIERGINSPEVGKLLNKQGLEAQTSSAEEFAALIHRDLALNAKLIKLSGAKAD